MTGTSCVIFKLKDTGYVIGGYTAQLLYALVPSLNGVTNVQHHSVVQEIHWDDACEDAWHNSGHPWELPSSQEAETGVTNTCIAPLQSDVKWNRPINLKNKNKHDLNMSFRHI